jgi:hypothetical protein
MSDQPETITYNGSMSIYDVRYSGVIARFAGKGCVALGFILGIYGLTESRPGLLKAGLALLVIGIVASAYGLFESFLHPPAPSAPRRAPSRLGASDNDDMNVR